MASLTEMISVSLTQKQNEALEKCSKDNDRKVGAMARVAIKEYLERHGYIAKTAANEDDEE